MLLEFHNQVAVITGSARGIGAAIAGAFFRQGARVALLDQNGEACQEYARTLDSTGEKVLAYQVDVADPEAVQAVIDQVMGQFQRIDILVNNAGILHQVPIDEKPVDEFERIMKVNLTGAFILCKTIIPIMKEQGRGKIVNMASLAARTGRPGVGVDYAASKAGMVALTQTLAREVGPAGIYVNAIAPGPILTELTKQVSAEVFATWNVGRAVKKDGLPEDVANAALFLASDMADWITGVTLDVNGGILIPH